MIAPNALLSATWETLVQHRRMYGIYALLLMAPILFFEGLQMFILDVDIDNTTLTTLFTTKNIIIGAITYIVTTLVTLWLTIAIMYSSYTILQHGTTPSVEADLKKALQPLIPFIVIGIIVSFIITVGVLLLIIPGIIFAIWLTFVYHVYLLEQTTIKEAFKRSTALVKGRFWKVFGRLALLTIVIGIASMAVLLLPTFLLPLVSFDILLPVLSTAVSAVSALFALVALTILYLSSKVTIQASPQPPLTDISPSQP